MKKHPPQDWEDMPEFDERCTCDEYEWEEHECPYASEINDDYTPCVCCPFCTQQCAWDI